MLFVSVEKGVLSVFSRLFRCPSFPMIFAFLRLPAAYRDESGSNLIL